MTIFVDILQAVEGKSEDAFTPSLETIAKNAARLQGIALDMSGAYYEAVREILLHVSVIFDRFHAMTSRIRSLANMAKTFTAYKTTNSITRSPAASSKSRQQDHHPETSSLRLP